MIRFTAFIFSVKVLFTRKYLCGIVQHWTQSPNDDPRQIQANKVVIWTHGNQILYNILRSPTKQPIITTTWEWLSDCNGLIFDSNVVWHQVLGRPRERFMNNEVTNPEMLRVDCKEPLSIIHRKWNDIIMRTILSRAVCPSKLSQQRTLYYFRLNLGIESMIKSYLIWMIPAISNIIK